jgi:hypothetical protein
MGEKAEGERGKKEKENARARGEENGETDDGCSGECLKSVEADDG